MLRLASLALVAALCASTAPAQPDLATDKHYVAGLRALEDRLPDLALRRLKDALETFKDDAAARRTISLKLGEAAVRAARMESGRVLTLERAREALAILAAADLKDDEQALFWSAQASLLLTDLPAAERYFADLADAKNADLRTRSRLARAHLLAVMGRAEEAETDLTALEKSPDPDVAGQARLLHASLLLARGRLDAVATLLPEGVSPANKSRAQHTRYLQARLALARGQHEKAIEAFQALEGEREQLGVTLHHGAIVGLADSLQRSGKLEEAVDRLLRFVDKNPRSPLLAEAIARLLTWARTDETVKGRFETQMARWSHFEESKSEVKPAPAETPKTESVMPATEKERAGYARYYRALYLAEKNTADSNTAAERLLESFRKDLPDHPLTPASLIEIARLQSAGERIPEAIATLRALDKQTASPALQAEGAKLIALLEFKEGNYQTAAETFLRVRRSLEPAEADLAAVNAGVSFLFAGDEGAFNSLLEGVEPSDLRAALLLEQALHQASLATTDARPLLDRFIAANRGHPRIAEARLARAEEWLHHEPDDPAAHRWAVAEFGAIRPAQLSYRVALRHLLARFRLAELTNNWGPAIAAAEEFLQTREPGDLESTIRLKLAEAYFNEGKKLNHAQRVFQQIATREQEGLIYEVALFFAAKSALKLGTEKSPEAAKLLRRVIEAEGTLANDARLLLARILIVPDPTEALETLKPLLAEEAPPEVQLDALALSAETNRALGGESSYREAIRIYDRILAREDLSYADSNRFHSLKGQIYDPLLKDPASALETYYRVINRENLPAGEEPSEWSWFTECGFKAVQILEKKRHTVPAAIEILRKLERSGNPYRKRAEVRRRDLELEHLHWE